jgi:hemerythrin
MRKTSEIIWQDAQHQVLFEILDLIREPGADREVLCRLKDYTENHFFLEEHYMAVLDYPGRAAHMAAHDRFRKEIDGLLGGEMEPDAQFMQLIGIFLTEWLTRHVFGVDKELEAFILRSKCK